MLLSPSVPVYTNVPLALAFPLSQLCGSLRPYSQGSQFFCFSQEIRDAKKGCLPRPDPITHSTVSGSQERVHGIVSRELAWAHTVRM